MGEQCFLSLTLERVKIVYNVPPPVFKYFIATVIKQVAKYIFSVTYDSIKSNVQTF